MGDVYQKVSKILAQWSPKETYLQPWKHAIPLASRRQLDTKADPPISHLSPVALRLDPPVSFSHPTSALHAAKG